MLRILILVGYFFLFKNRASFINILEHCKLIMNIPLGLELLANLQLVHLKLCKNDKSAGNGNW